MKKLAVLLGISVIFILATSANASPDWWNTSFKFRQNFSSVSNAGYTIDNFHAYVKLNTSSLISAGLLDGSCLCLRAGNDTTEYQMVWENCNNTNGTGIYIQIPKYYNGTNNFFVYWDNGTCADGRNLSIYKSEVLNITYVSPESGLCTGTCTSCGSYSNQSSCQAQGGCSWGSSYVCQAIPNCYGLYPPMFCDMCPSMPDEFNCLNGLPVPACEWVLGGDACSGDCTSCGSLSNQSNCNAEAGCSWSLLHNYGAGGGIGFPNVSIPTMYGAVGWNGNWNNKAYNISISGGTSSVLNQTLSESIADTGGVQYQPNNSVYIFGGDVSGGYTNKIVRITPDGNVTTMAATLTSARRDTCPAVVDNAIILMGGAGVGVSQIIERYYPENSTISSISANGFTNGQRAGCYGFNSLHVVYAAGGYSSGIVSDILMVYPNGSVVNTNKDLNISVQFPVCGGWDSSNLSLLYCMGGSDSAGTTKYGYIWEYNITSNIVTTLNQSMSIPRNDHRCGQLDKSIYCVNGYNSSGSIINSVERYDMRIASAQQGAYEQLLVASSLNLTFVSPTPANGTTINSTSFTANVSSNGTVNSCNLTLDGTNYSMTIASGNLSASITNSGLSQGLHTYNATCDGFMTETRTLNIDSIAPTITITSPANTSYTTTNIALQVSANEVINAWWYKLNGGTNTTFTPNTTITASQGNNNIIVYANDTVGNIGNSQVFFFVDSIPPTITIYSPQNITYNNVSQVNLDVSANETINTWRYSINGGSNTTFTPNTTINIANGSNTLIIYANDTVGNIGQASVSFTANYPTVTYLNSPDNGNMTISDVPIEMAFNCSAINDINLSNISLYFGGDGIGWHLNETRDITGVYNFSVFVKILPIGDYSWSCYACDYADQCSWAVPNWTLSITVPLNITITSPQNISYNTTSIRLNVTANKAINIWIYSLNGGTNTTFTSNTTVTASQGSNNIRVWANDSYGILNTSIVYFFVDSIAPSIIIYSPQNTSYNTTSIALQVSANETINTWWFDLDGGGNITFSPNTTLPTPLQGINTIIVYANDTVGNIGSANISFFVDSIPPNITITSPQNTSYNITNIPLQVSASETVNAWWYKLNGGANTTFTPNTTITATQGINNLTVYANDTIGNIGSRQVFFFVDSIPPTITIYSPQNITYTFQDTAIISLNVSASQTINAWWYKLNGGSNTTFIPNSTITASQGSNTLTVYANDTIGNIGSSSVDFTVEFTGLSQIIIAPFNMIAGLALGAAFIIFILNTLFSIGIKDLVKDPKVLIIAGIGVLIFAVLLAGVF